MESLSALMLAGSLWAFTVPSFPAHVQRDVIQFGSPIPSAEMLGTGFVDGVQGEDLSYSGWAGAFDLDAPADGATLVVITFNAGYCEVYMARHSSGRRISGVTKFLDPSCAQPLVKRPYHFNARRVG